MSAQPAYPAYRTGAARASQYRLELDHLKHSRDNAMRREHELERALDEERHRASTREAELKRSLRNAKYARQVRAPPLPVPNARACCPCRSAGATAS